MPYVPTFDGLERAPAPAEVRCPACGARIRFDLWDAVDRGRPGWRLSDAEVHAHALTRRAERGFTVTLAAPDGPAAHLVALTCPGCGATTDVPVGLGEFQPCRWVGGVVTGP
jgi:hypothetical protein